MRFLCGLFCSFVLISALPFSALAFEEELPIIVVEDDFTAGIVTEPVLLNPEPEVSDPAPVVSTPVIEDPSPEPVESPYESGLYAIDPYLYDPDYYDEGGNEDPAGDDTSVMSVYRVAALDDFDGIATFDLDSQTMKDVIFSLFGEYSPRTQTVTQYLSDGSAESFTEIVPGIAGLDWAWIAGVSLFALVLGSFLKMVGVLLKNG